MITAKRNEYFKFSFIKFNPIYRLNVFLFLLLAVVSSNANAGSWKYEKNKDEMTGKITIIASKTSLNTVNFDFPYQGKQHGTIVILEGDALFLVEKGQLICYGEGEYNSCTVLVKFDDTDAQEFNAYIIGDESTALRIREANDFIDALKKSKKMKIKVQAYQNGFPIFNFDVNGFDENRLFNK